MQYIVTIQKVIKSEISKRVIERINSGGSTGDRFEHISNLIEVIFGKKVYFSE